MFVIFSVQDCRAEPSSSTCRRATAPKQPPARLSSATPFLKERRSISANKEKTSAAKTDNGTIDAVRKVNGIGKGSGLAGVATTGLTEAPLFGEDFIDAKSRTSDCS